MSAQIKKAGLKVTGPRMKILEIMERETTDNDRHLSAEDVYKILLKADEDIGLATVYRVLTQFEQAGILKRHNFEGNHSVFEIRRQSLILSKNTNKTGCTRIRFLFFIFFIPGWPQWQR